MSDSPPPGDMPEPSVDPDLIWTGERKAVSPGKATYRLTREYLMFDAGTFASRSEQIPLWTVRDIDVRQGIMQKSRGVGDVAVHVERSDHTGRSLVILESVEEPHRVRDLINTEAQRARREYQQLNQSTYHHASGMAPPSPVPQAAPAAAPVQQPAPASVADEIRKLAELREMGALTDEEFAAQKAKLLG